MSGRQLSLWDSPGHSLPFLTANRFFLSLCLWNSSTLSIIGSYFFCCSLSSPFFAFSIHLQANRRGTSDKKCFHDDGDNDAIQYWLSTWSGRRLVLKLPIRDLIESLLQFHERGTLTCSILTKGKLRLLGSSKALHEHTRPVKPVRGREGTTPQALLTAAAGTILGGSHGF